MKINHIIHGTGSTELVETLISIVFPWLVLLNIWSLWHTTVLTYGFQDIGKAREEKHDNLNPP